MNDASLIFLSQIRNNLEYANLDLIKLSIADLRNKFIPIAILHKGYYIDRVRINHNNKIFKTIDDVNYINDEEILNTHVDFGRANFPKQSIFYGSIESPQIKKTRGTAWLETTDIFKNKNVLENIEQIFTSCRWRILEDIPIVEIIFSKEALKNSKYVQQSFAKQIEGIKDHSLYEHFFDQGEFFSEEFARDDCFKKPFNY
jgi:hypothetical protein